MMAGSVLRRFHWGLFACAASLAAVGILFVYSATAETSGWAEARTQMMFVAISLVVFTVLVVPSYRLLMRIAFPLYFVILALLVGLLLFAPEVNGAKSWFKIGSRRIQPSEMAKFALVLALARYLMYRENYKTLMGLAGPLLITLVPMALILKQPDLGTAIIFLPAMFVMLFMAGARLRHLGCVILVGLTMLPVLYFALLTPGQRKRISGFLQPDEYASTASYQGTQSIIAIGSGGVFGQGFRQGTHSKLGFVPLTRNDFIFTVIAEERGFVGATAVLGVFLLMFVMALEIAGRTREPFGRLVVVGCISLLAFQVLVNVGVALQLMPTTGVTLPFVSQGGSSLVTSFALLALIINVGMHRIPVLARDTFR